MIYMLSQYAWPKYCRSPYIRHAFRSNRNIQSNIIISYRTHLPLLICLFLIVCATPIFGSTDDIDPFGQFYVEQRRVYYEVKEYTVEERMAILNELERDANRSNQSPYVNGARFWIAQEYSTLGRPLMAIPIFKQLLNDPKTSPSIRSSSRYEYGLSLYRAKKEQEAKDVWTELINDEKESTNLRTAASEKLMQIYMSKQDWKSLRETAKMQLKYGFGSYPVLYEYIARSSRRMSDYEYADKYYQKLLMEYPDYRPKDRMMYI